jgi:hypothetical protein
MLSTFLFYFERYSNLGSDIGNNHGLFKGSLQSGITQTPSIFGGKSRFPTGGKTLLLQGMQGAPGLQTQHLPCESVN